MGQPHKHAEIIKAWADGAEIQYRFKDSGSWIDTNKPEWETCNQYRIKPKTIKYRNYLWKSICFSEGKPVVSCCSYEDNIYDNREKWSGFISWLGDWKEVEV